MLNFLKILFYDENFALAIQILEVQLISNGKILCVLKNKK